MIVISTEYGELDYRAQQVEVVVEYRGSNLDIDPPEGDFDSYTYTYYSYTWGQRWVYTFDIPANTSSSTKYGTISFSMNSGQDSASWEYEQEPGSTPVPAPVTTILNNGQSLPYTQNEFNILVGYKNVTSSAGTSYNISSPLTLVSSSFSNSTGSYRVRVAANPNASSRTITASFTGSNASGRSSAQFTGTQAGIPSIGVSPATKTVDASNVSDYTVTVTYYNLTGTAQIRQPACDPGIDVTVTSTSTTSAGIVRVYTVSVDNNTSQSSVTKTITFENTYGQTGTHTVTQAGRKWAEPNPSSGNYTEEGGSKTVYVTYHGVSSINTCQYRPLHSWVTISRTGYNYSGADTIVTYSVSVPATEEYYRNSVAFFYGTAGSGVDTGSFYVYQRAEPRVTLTTSANPKTVPDVSFPNFSETIRANYLHVTASSAIGTPYSPNSWITVSPGSVVSSGSAANYNYGQDITVTVANNVTTTPRTGSVIVSLAGGNPSTATWTIYQEGGRLVSCSVDYLDFSKAGGYQDVTVTYINTPASAIQTPTSSVAWCSIEQRSSSTSGNNVVRVYRITTTQNTGVARNETIWFTATGATNDYVTVRQAKDSWVEIDASTTNPLTLESTDTANHSGRVLLINETDSAGLTYTNSANWLSVTKGSGGQGTGTTYYYQDFTVRATSNNTSHSDRTAYVTFNLSGSSDTWTITQEGVREAVVNTSSLSFNYAANSATVQVTFYNAGTIDNCKVTNNYSWLTVTRGSYSTSGRHVTVTYTIAASANADWARTGHIDFYVQGYGPNYARTNVTQGTHVYASLVTSNPTNVPDSPTTPTAIVDYYHISASGPISTPSGYPTWIRAVYVSGSDQTLNYGVRRGWYAEVRQNNDSAPRTGSITFGVSGGDSCTWTIQQAGSVRIEASTHLVNFQYGSGYQDITVSYYNIPEANIQTPSSSTTWCSVSQISTSTSGSVITRTYRITVATNPGEERGATVGFTATGAAGDYITVAQGKKIWVELDASTPSSISVPFVDSGSTQTIYKTSVWYRNVRTGSSDIQTPRSNYDWLVLVSSSCLYEAGVGARYDYFWYPVDNLEDVYPRTDWWFFGLTGGDPDEVYQRVDQEGPKYVDLDTGSISQDWHSGSYTVHAKYYNVAGSDIQPPVGAGDWVTVTETHRNVESYYIGVTYSVVLSQNDDWARSTRRTFYAIGSYDQPILNISQSARIYVTLTSASNPSYVSNTPGLDGQLPVWGRLNYYHTNNTSLVSTPVSDSSWARISDSSSFVTTDYGFYQDIGLYVANNLTTGSREANFTFGIQGGEPGTVTWKVIQDANETIVANPRIVNIAWSGGVGTVEVSYTNIAASYITAPVISGSVSWITGISEVSRTTSCNTIKITYAITASQNLSWARGATVEFGCSKPGVTSDYISVAQGQKTWVEIDDDDQYKVTDVPARDPSDNYTWYYSTITYYNVRSGSADILPPVASSDNIVLEYSGSISSSLGAKYVYRVRALDNFTTSSRLTSIYFNLTGGDPGQATWNIRQTGQRDVEVTPIRTDVHWSGSSYNVEALFINCPTESIYNPVISGSWITASLVSEEQEGNRIRQTWNLTIPENKDWERTGSIRFNAVPETLADPPVLAYHWVQQDTHRWPEIINPSGSLLKIAGVGGNYTSSVFYWHTRDASKILEAITGSSTPTGMIERIQRDSLVSQSQGWQGNYTLTIKRNSSPEPRTGSVVFTLVDGEPDTATLRLEQKPGLEIDSYPSNIILLGSDRIVYDTASTDYPLTVYWKGVDPSSSVLYSGSTTGSYQTGSGTWITGSFSGSWTNVIEQSRSVYTSESGSTVVTYYRLEIDRNYSAERTMSVVFRSEEEEAVTVLVQPAEKRIVIPSSPITSSVSGGYYDFTVYYYFTSQSELLDPLVTGTGGTVGLGHIYQEQDRLRVDYQLHTSNNTSVNPIEGTITCRTTNEAEPKVLPWTQPGKKMVDVEPDVATLASNESLFVIGATFFNISESQILTPITSSDLIEIESTTGFPVGPNFVKLYSVRLPENALGEIFTGSLTARTSESQSASVLIVQGGTTFINTIPQATVLSASNAHSSITASYFNCVQADIKAPVSSSADLTLTQEWVEVTSSNVSSSLPSKVIIVGYDLTATDNTGSGEKEMWIRFSTQDINLTHRVTQRVESGVTVEPTGSYFTSQSEGKVVTVTYRGISEEQDVDDPIKPAWISVQEQNITTVSGSLQYSYLVTPQDNESIEPRSGSVTFTADNRRLSGSLEVYQDGAARIVFNPASMSIYANTPVSFSVEVTYLNYTDSASVGVVEHSVGLTDPTVVSQEIVGNDLKVVYSSQANVSGAGRKFITFGTPYSQRTFDIWVVPSPSNNPKITPTSVKIGYPSKSVEFILEVDERWFDSRDYEFQGVTGSAYLTSDPSITFPLQIQEISVSESIHRYSYMVTVDENTESSNRVIRVLGDVLYRSGDQSRSVEVQGSITQNSRGAGNITLDYSSCPIWMTNNLTIYNTAQSNLEIDFLDRPTLVSTSYDGTIYSKVIYAAPGQDNIVVDVNRILENYMQGSIPDLRDDLWPSAHKISGYLPSASIQVGGNTAELVLLNDWSYKERNDYGLLSNPINTSLALGQWMPLMFAGVPSSSYISGSGEEARYVLDYQGPINAEPFQIHYGPVVEGAWMLVLRPINFCGTWMFDGKYYKTVNARYVLYYYNKFGGVDSIPVEGVVLPEVSYERSTIGRQRLHTTDYDILGSKTYELNTGFFNDLQAEEVDNIVGSPYLLLQDLKDRSIVRVRGIDDSVEIKSFRNQDRKFPVYAFKVQEVETKRRK